MWRVVATDAAHTHHLVVVAEVDPPTQTGHDALPLVAVAGHDGAAVAVVRGDAHLHHLLRRRDAERLVDLVLHGQTVAVPAEAATRVRQRQAVGAGSQ